MPRLALYTFGVFTERADDPVNDGFYRRNDPVMASAERAAGFIARSGYAADPGPASWGKEVYPRFYQERGDNWCPATLSLWTDLESALTFAYSGRHAEALAHGREWFLKPEWPPYVLWWVEDTIQPIWRDGVNRLEYLHDYGPSATAFNFKQAFDAIGTPVKVSRERLRAPPN